jgi:hypothetical protein
MKMTVVMSEKGDLVAAQQGPISHPERVSATGGNGPHAGLRAGQGQKLHEIDVPDHVAQSQDAHEFLNKIKPHLPKH